MTDWFSWNSKLPAGNGFASKTVKVRPSGRAEKLTGTVVSSAVPTTPSRPALIRVMPEVASLLTSIGLLKLIWIDLTKNRLAFCVMLVDAMSLLVEDTEPLAHKYGKAKNGKPSCDHARPTPKLLALLDLAGGYIHQVIPLPWSRQERVCLTRLLKA